MKNITKIILTVVEGSSDMKDPYILLVKEYDRGQELKDVIDLTEAEYKAFKKVLNELVKKKGGSWWSRSRPKWPTDPKPETVA